MRICFPNGEHSDVSFREGELSFGSAAGNRVRLAAEGVQARHAVIRIEPQRGTLLQIMTPGALAHVNGRPVSEVALLRMGDVVSLGHVRLLLKPDDDRSIDVRMPQAAAAASLDGAARAAASRVVLRGVAGAFHGRSVSLQDKILIGRSASAQVRVDEPDFPDQLASMEIDGDRILMRHLGSDESIVVNGVAVKSAVLHPGDQISFDIHRFVIEAPGLPQRGSLSEPPPQAGAHMGNTQTMRAVRVEPPTPQPAPEPELDESESESGGRVWWLLVAALLIAGGIAAFAWYGNPLQ